jgi:hypothetical protein
MTTNSRCHSVSLCRWMESRDGHHSAPQFQNNGKYLAMRLAFGSPSLPLAFWAARTQTTRMRGA